MSMLVRGRNGSRELEYHSEFGSRHWVDSLAANDQYEHTVVLDDDSVVILRGATGHLVRMEGRISSVAVRGQPAHRFRLWVPLAI